MKNILIVGMGSFVAESLYRWLKQSPNLYKVNIVSSMNEEWKKVDWTQYEVVIDCAGIAHINNITEDMRELFYSVNRDLSINIATWAKQNGVKHFIIFSSMNVYGDCVNKLQDRLAENPTSFYGDSKLQGDRGIMKLEDESFIVSYLRPPFIYGKGCKGNYNSISKIAQRTPVFPTYKNQKSMIYIDNLCEFVRLVIDERLGGILTPQNKELVSTFDLVKEIAKCHKKTIWFTGVFNWTIKPASRMIRMVQRAFANDCYSLDLSNYWGFKYCIVSFEDSIKKTELDI